MTTFEALVSISQTLLRARGEWQGNATAHADIDRAVNQAADLIRGDDRPDLVTLDLIKMTIAELRRRGGIRGAA